MGEAAVAEEQPRATASAGGAALLHEGAERRDAGAGADHDDVPVRRRKREMLVGLELDPQPAAFLEPLGDIGRGDALSRAAMGLVAHGGNQQMRLFAYFAARGGDRIGARRQRTASPRAAARRTARSGTWSIRSMSWRPAIHSSPRPSSISALTY